jgi:hypothetical protein
MGRNTTAESNNQQQQQLPPAGANSDNAALKRSAPAEQGTPLKAHRSEVQPFAAGAGSQPFDETPVGQHMGAPLMHDETPVGQTLNAPPAQLHDEIPVGQHNAQQPLMHDEIPVGQGAGAHAARDATSAAAPHGGAGFVAKTKQVSKDFAHDMKQGAKNLPEQARHGAHELIDLLAGPEKPQDLQHEPTAARATVNDGFEQRPPHLQPTPAASQPHIKKD